MWRLLNTLVIVALLGVAGYVYSIKYEATFHAERAARLRNDIRQEREAIAALRAEWARLNAPSRLQALAEKHLALRPVEVSQFDTLDKVPMRPPVSGPDPIGSLIDMIAEGEPRITGTVKGDKP